MLFYMTSGWNNCFDIDSNILLEFVKSLLSTAIYDPKEYPGFLLKKGVSWLKLQFLDSVYG